MGHNPSGMLRYGQQVRSLVPPFPRALWKPLVSNYVHLSDLAICSHMYPQEILTQSCRRWEEVL